MCGRHRQLLVDALGGQPYAVPSAVVYYLVDRDTRQVKIGSTTRMTTRFEAIRKQRPDLELLAVEPGYRDLERRRHHQFVRSRVVHHGGNREWYHRSQELVDLINKLRQEHGDPWQHPAVRAVPR